MRKVVVLIALQLAIQTGLVRAADLKVQTRYSIPGHDGWDYITVDSINRRVYVSHSVRVNVLDEDTGAAVGIIENTPGVHGIAIAPRQKHGLTSNGKEDKVSMFDITTLAVIKKIAVGDGPDGIYFDAAQSAFSPIIITRTISPQLTQPLAKLPALFMSMAIEKVL